MPNGYLLDTHVLLWWFSDPALLSERARDIIADEANTLLVSSVCTWEIVIKRALGKLEVPDEIFDLIPQEGFVELPVTIAHTKTLASLPRYHTDPFDRLLVAQSEYENTPMISRDERMQEYPISIVEA